MGERPSSFIPDAAPAPKSFIPDAAPGTSAQDVKKRPLLMGTSDAGIAQQLPNDPQALAQVRAAQAPLENAAAIGGAGALGATAGLMAASPVAQGIAKVAGYAGAYHAGRALGIPTDVMNGLMIMAGAREGVAGAIRGGFGKGMPEPEPQPTNAGGVLVPRQEPTLNDVIGDALDALRRPEQAKAVTLPPQPTLPPGYTPRATAPPVASPSGMASMEAAAPSASTAAAPPPRPYFLKPEAQMAPQAAPAAPPQELPSAWAQFAKPASFPPKELEGSGLAAVFDQELAKRGMNASEAIPQVLRNKALTSDVRAQLVSALEKVARKQAGVSAPSMTEPTLPASWQALVQK